MLLKTRLWVGLACLCLACGGSGGTGEVGSGTGGSGSGGAPGAPPADLSKPVVTALPSGSASGAAFTGQYSLMLRTLSCQGSCGPVPGPFDTQLSYCDVGETDFESWDIEQTDGALSTDINMDVDIHMVGGVHADGAFDIGGWGTELAGQVEATARATGKLLLGGTEGVIEQGSLRMYSAGVDNGVSIACLATYAIEPN